MKRVALSALWIAIIIESAWIIARLAKLRGGTSGVVYPLLVTGGFASLAVSRGRYRWINALLRVFIGIAFVSAVCDRLGFFGGPGRPGVSWGNFTNFTIYAGQVKSFLPTSLIPAIAVIETVIEGVLGVAMLLGISLRFTVWASTVLLCLFGTAMTISLGFSSTFPFAVFVLAAGALVLTGADSWAIGMRGSDR